MPPPKHRHWASVADSILGKIFSTETAREIADAYEEVKGTKSELGTVASWGEQAAKENKGPAGPLIACQAATFFYLLGLSGTPQEGYDAASDLLGRGTCYENLMQFIEHCR